MAATARWASLVLPRPSPGIDLSSQSELFADVRAPQQSHQGSPTSSTSSSAGQYRSSLRFEDSRMPRWHCGPLWVKMTAATVLRVSSMCTGDPNLVKFFFHMCAQANPTTGFHREHMRACWEQPYHALPVQSGDSVFYLHFLLRLSSFNFRS